MKTLALAFCAVVAASPVLAQSVGEKTGVNSALGITPKTEDFVREAAMSDMFEIQSSKMALEKADAPTKAFANRMIADHQKTTAAITAMVQKGTVKADLPTAMSSSQQSMLDKLNGLTGADFTREYHSDQVSAHKDAVSLFDRYAKGGDNAALKSFARKTEPTLKRHLAMAEKLNK